MAHYPKIFDYTGVGGGTSSYDRYEIAWGTGVGSTSSDAFLYYDNATFSQGGRLKNVLILGNTQSGISNITSTFSTTFEKSFMIGTTFKYIETFTSSNLNTRGLLTIGLSHNANSSCNSVIIGGECNSLNAPFGWYNKRNAIIAGLSSSICASSDDAVIVGGFFNRMYYGNYKAAIIGGLCNQIKASCAAGILIGSKNSINSSNYSSLLGGNCNTIATFSYRSSISGGQCNTIACSSLDSSLVGGYRNRIYSTSNRSLILGGTTNRICNSSDSSLVGSSGGLIATASSFSSIVGGNNNKMYCSVSSSIIGGDTNQINLTSNRSSIIGGDCNRICLDSNRSTIVGGCCNMIIGTSSDSLILGGCNNIIGTFSCNSVIIGGMGLTLSNECSIAFVPKLKIATASNNDSGSRLLVWDTDNYVKWRCDTTISGSTIPNGVTGSTPYYTGSAWTYSNTNIYNTGTRVGIGGTGSTASSDLHVFGSLSLDLTTITASTYTLTDSNFTLLVNTPAGGATVSLPTAASARHRIYVIKKIDSSTASIVRVRPSGGDNIEGFTGNITLDYPYDYYMLQSNGVNLWIKLGGAGGVNL